MSEFDLKQSYDVDKFRNEFEHSMTWLNGFMRNVRRYSKKTALHDPESGIKWTYSELNAQVNRLAHALAADGVKKGDVVLYQLLNSPQFVQCYIAPQKLGAVNSPADFKLSAGETAAIIDHNKPKIYIYDADCLKTALGALKLAKYRPERIIMVDYYGKHTDAPEGHILFSDYISGKSTSDPVVNESFSIYDEITRFYTSGTTSLPKGVPVNNIGEVLTAHDNCMNLKIDADDITMNTTPWFHRGGVHIGGPTPSLYAGASMIVMRNSHPKVCLEYIERYSVTFIVSVPAVLDLMVIRQEQQRFDLSTLRGITSMGSPLERSACIKYMEVLAPNIYNGYGTTETFVNTMLFPSDLPEKAGYTGRAFMDDDVRVVKIYEGRKAEPDELVAKDNKAIGEVIIKSPSKSTFTYYGNDEMTKEKFYNGYMYTGDLATWDEYEYITVAGRKDDMVIISGENVYPAQIEEVLNAHDKVADCIVTGVPNKLRGQVLAAYIIPSDPSLTAAELIDYCKNHPNLPKFKRPKYYRFVEDIPRTATGKKQHYRIKEQAKFDLENGMLVKK